MEGEKSSSPEITEKEGSSTTQITERPKSFTSTPKDLENKQEYFYATVYQKTWHEMDDYAESLDQPV